MNSQTFTLYTQPWSSEGEGRREPNREFSFFLIESKKTFFVAKRLIGKCQISKFREAMAPFYPRP